MPESRAIADGAISGALPLTLALLRGGKVMGPKMVAKLGRTTEAQVAADSSSAFAQSAKGIKALDAEDLRSLLTALVGADIFAGAINQRPGTRQKMIEKAFGTIPQNELDDYRRLKALGMPVQGDPRMSVNVIETGQRGTFLRQRLGLE